MNIIVASDDLEVVTRDRLAELKLAAFANKNKRSRLILTPGYDMVICLAYGSYVRPHRHPKEKSESYHVIEGEMTVTLYWDHGIEFVELDKETPIYRLRGGVYHSPVAISPFVIYHEVYTGPFVKEVDVEYAPWAREEE